MDREKIDWSKPIRLMDNHAQRIEYDGPAPGTDVWLKVPGHHRAGGKAKFTFNGTHIAYEGEHYLGGIENVPAIDMEQPLYWTDTDERAFVRERFYDSSKLISYSVDDPQGKLYHVTPDGYVHDSSRRTLANMTDAQQQAAARVAINRAQVQRQLARDRAALEELADLNPMFGQF